MTKIIIPAFVFALGTSFLCAAEFQLSTHVLDTTSGTPGAGVKVILEKKSDEGKWTEVAEAVTGKDGRYGDFLEKDGKISHIGTYRFTFGLEEYFEAKGVTPVFPEAVVVFKITDQAHYHIPVVVTPYAISTYRGS